MTTLVTGGAGFIGSAVVRKLLERGRQVRCLVETNGNTRNLDGLDVEIVHGDITDRHSMKQAIRGCQSLFHLAALYKMWLRDPARMYDVNVEGSKTVLFAALNEGVKKVVYTSSIASIGREPDGRLSDETTAFNLWDESNHYVRSKWLGERDALRFAREGLPVVVVNPAFPFGPRDAAPTPTGGFVIESLKERIPGYTEGGFNAVDVEDVAEAHLLAESKGTIGQRYILGNHNVTYKEFYDAVSDIAGVKPITRKLPMKLGLGIAWAMEKYALARNKPPRITYKGALYASRTLWFDCTKAQDELGMPQTPLRETIAKAVDWFRSNGYA